MMEREPAGVTPCVSVVVPTFRRPAMLVRAAESVLEQGFDSFEIIISDDDPVPGAGWHAARRLARLDRRVRVTRNPGPRGQVHNANHALALARGRWIKPLWDDDVLRPGALAALVHAAESAPGTALAACLADHYCRGRRRRRESRGGRAPVERLSGRDALLAMYLQDIEIGIPSQVLVRGDIVAAGVRLRRACGIETGVDLWWYARLLRHGALVLVNRALVERHQGHATITSRTTRDRFFTEQDRLRAMYRSLMPGAGGAVPPVQTARALDRLIHAAVDLRAGRPLHAAARAAGVRDTRAWALAARWALRRAFPGWFELVPRIPVAVGAPAASVAPAPARRNAPRSPLASSAVPT